MVRVKLAKPTQVGGRIRQAGDVVDVADSRVAHFDANGYVAEYMDDVDLVSGDGTVHVRHEDPDPNGPVEAHFETQAEAIAYAKQIMLEEGFDVVEPDDEHINVYVSGIADPILRFHRDSHNLEDVVRAVSGAFAPVQSTDNQTREWSDIADLIPHGIDEETVEALLKGGYDSVGSLVLLSAKDLQALENIGKARSQQIVDAVRRYTGEAEG